MKNAGLLEAPRRGYFRVTDRGREVLAKNPDHINVEYLTQYPEFREFKARRGSCRRRRSLSGSWAGSSGNTYRTARGATRTPMDPNQLEAEEMVMGLSLSGMFRGP